MNIYKVICDVQPDGGMMYGIALEGTEKRISNLSYRLSHVDHLALLCTAHKLSPIHLEDIVDDFLYLEAHQN